MDIHTTNTQRLGEMLVRSGKLAAEQLEQVINLQSEKGGLLGPLLVQLGFIGERDLAEALAETMGWALADKTEFLEPPSNDIAVSTEFLRQHHAVPMALQGDRVAVALADPGDGFVLDALKLALGRPIDPRIGLISDIQAALARHFPNTEAATKDNQCREIC